MDTNNNLLIDELKHDVERERWLALWARYRTVILGALALVVLGTGAHSYWQHATAKRNMELTETLYNAVTPETMKKPDNVAASLSSFAAANAGTPAAFMAEMQAAGVLLYSDNKDGAAAHLQAALAMDDIDENLRAVATLQYVQAVLDTAETAPLVEKLKPYVADSSPYRFHAWELMALLAQRDSDGAKAQGYLTKIIDDSASPATLRSRALNLQRVLK